ncbi:MAG: hypothetical protein EP216_01705 [Epsilonproteobacteria bacterium]|nr:MAG: hypothetical protein EP216_01705 [Campylobacterota bacterium]
MHDHNLDDLIIDNIEPKDSKLKSLLTIIALLIVVLIVAIVLTRILLKTPENNDLIFEQESAELIAPELKLQETPKPSETKPEPKPEPSLPKIIESQLKAPTVETKKTEVVQKPEEVVKKEEPKPVVKPPIKPKVIETKKEPVLSNITEKEVKAPEAVQEISSAEQAAKDAADKAYWESVQAKRKAEQEAREKAEKEAKEKSEREAKEALQREKAAAAKKAKEAVVQKPKPVAKPVQKPVASKPVPKSTSGKKYYVQVGSFKNQPSTRFISVIRNNGFKYRILRSPKDGTKKLLIGPYGDRASVNRALVEVRDRINKRAFVVKR